MFKTAVLYSIDPGGAVLHAAPIGVRRNPPLLRDPSNVTPPHQSNMPEGMVEALVSDSDIAREYTSDALSVRAPGAQPMFGIARHAGRHPAAFVEYAFA